ncbi:protein lsr2 precursor [Gordonia spumicola]|uniref:Protein lsr2 n=1 Tax=Gordonia spumicola TaxID=589161 RepID=A0A7I9VET3_9ACTN|nr:Lsr2 family protein [Gordonia spumicola]GEE03837.1 protein lsr2 precursor [Gordonia spumicola]
MAKKTVIKIVDDIDGAELLDDEYETVRWSIDGKSYEFDTSPEHAEEFRNHVATYVAASRIVNRAQQRRPATGGTRPAANTRVIREWANANGFTVSDRGRIPADVLAAYEAAN